MIALLALLLCALLATPGGAALDALPGASSTGVLEARILVQLAPGGTLRVAADAPLHVALVGEGGQVGAFHPAPAQLSVDATQAWHGLPGAVEVVLRRDAALPVRVELDDGASGVVFEWPAGPTRGIPMGSPAIGTVAAASIGALAWRRRLHAS